MVRSFLNAFEKLLSSVRKESDRGVAMQIARQYLRNSRTHPEARVPARVDVAATLPIERPRGKKLNGMILTGEMFAPILGEQIAEYNRLAGTKLRVLAVPNTYFGGDVSVAGLLTGQDYLNIADQVKGEFVIIPKHTIKSDEPILLDGMSFEELKSKFPVPIYDLDTNGLIEFLSR